MEKKEIVVILLLFTFLLIFFFTSFTQIPGDFNGDGQVEFNDLMIFALAYGSCEGDDNWDSRCDLNSDGCIEFNDLMIFALHYGECEQGTIWTVMVYMCGDNNLDDYAWYDLTQMQSVGSTGEVNIVVQLDPDANTSCPDTYRYYVTGVEQGTSYPLYPDDIVQTLPEQNMADPTVLNDFISWAMNYYPAEKYLLILWDHGAGWRDENILSKGIIVDDTSGDYMTMAQLVQGLEGISDSIDILGFDACLMQMIEVYYELGMNISNPPAPCYGIGSQASEWAYGWPYDTILTDLTGNPSMTENTLCETIVNNYINNCGPSGTLSALNFCSGADPVEGINIINSFANALMNSSYQSEISLARLSAQSYNSPDYKDLYHFAEIIYDNIPDCQSEAQEVMNLVNDVVFANQYTGVGLDNSHGLSIYLPDSPGEYDNSYDMLQFTIDTQWDEFLKFGPAFVSQVYAQTITYQATSMDKIEDKMEQLAIEGKIQDSYRLNEISPTTKGTTQHVISVDWLSYPEATGYNVYRSVNGGNPELIYWDEPTTIYDWYGFYDADVLEGNSYTYYVTAYGSDWETDPSPEVTIDTWLPPCSLLSPADASIITDPTPTFTWNPVGLNTFPYGSIFSGESDLWIYDTTVSETAWSIWFGNMTTSLATYNQDGQALPLQSGNTYIWDSWGYGYDLDDNLIAISQSEDWGFDYDEGVTPPDTHRALLVGVGDYMYGDNDLSAPPYDVDKMHDTLSNSGNGLTLVNILKDLQATKSAILTGIANTFSQADPDDVSYFYFSGHGTNYEGTSYLVPTDAVYLEDCISVNELETSLNEIPGTKVVFLDACHSGGFIGKEINQTAIEVNTIEFNEDVINAFSSRDLTTSQYQVLTSCLSTQSCSEFYFSGYDPFGLFTAILCEGCGYDYYTQPYWADADSNSEITLEEAYDYTYQQVNSFIDQYNAQNGTSLDQDTQVYPDNSNFVIIEE